MARAKASVTSDQPPPLTPCDTCRPRCEIHPAAMARPIHRLPVGSLLATLNWSTVDKLAARYQVGVPFIDAQHRILFAWCLALAATTETRLVLRGFRAYAGTHFADEEAWAKAQGLASDGHQALHRDLLARVDALIADSDPDRGAVEALAMDWLCHHIDHEDRALAAAVRS